MKMVEKIALTEQMLEEKLQEMAPEWKTGKNEKGVPYIERVHHASKFMEGIAFVGKVAEAAEANNHHPDIILTINVLLYATGLTQRVVSP